MRKLAPKGKRYSVLDSDGLYIEVLPGGGKHWRIRKKLKGKEIRAELTGLRGMVSTILNENGWPVDAIERLFAHVERSGARAAYNLAEYLLQRREMMQWWADWLDEQGRNRKSQAEGAWLFFNSENVAYR